MTSVSAKPQAHAHAVAPRSRAAAARLVAALVAAALPASAAPVTSSGASSSPAPSLSPSAERASAAAPPAAIPPLASPRKTSYRLALATLYTLAPFAAAGVGHALSRSGGPDSLVVVGAGAMFFAPAVLHIAHGKAAHGVLSFLGIAAGTTIGTIVGGFIGGMITYGQCDPDEDSDGCDFAAYEGLAYGLVIGGVLSYAGIATYDVLEHGSVVTGETSADQVSPDRALQLWVRPAPSPFGEHAEARPLFGGLQLGVLMPW
jgi:hypothetical protein